MVKKIKEKLVGDFKISLEDNLGMCILVIYEGSKTQKSLVFPYLPTVEKQVKGCARTTYNEWKEKLLRKDPEFLSTFNFPKSI